MGLELLANKCMFTGKVVPYMDTAPLTPEGLHQQIIKVKKVGDTKSLQKDSITILEGDNMPNRDLGPSVDLMIVKLDAC